MADLSYEGADLVSDVDTFAVQIAGEVVVVATGVDEDSGWPYIRLHGQDCDLVGEAPGLYFLKPIRGAG